MNAIEVENLTKTFPGFKLDNIGFTLPSGCILGLVGENGAGKSTTIKLILDILHKDGGSIRVLGRENTEDVKAMREDVGVVMDAAGIPECLNARQVGKVMSGTFRNWNNGYYNETLQRLAIPDNKPYGELSRGMKMKLGIAVALSHGSKLLLLDEPTSGLDPVIRDEVVNMFHEFTRDENHSILISSHIVSDLERLCDYIAFLHKGKLLLFEEKDVLLGEYGVVRCAEEQLGELDEAALIHKKITPYGAEAIVRRDAVPASMTVSPISVEELFVYMVKEELQ
ncbi:MAG: ABC transporter ATP-binding protein [Ruminococcus sp.]|nr:ABC transporter ATP-binding protein [Ruminococcus sp.]